MTNALLDFLQPLLSPGARGQAGEGGGGEKEDMEQVVEAADLVQRFR